MVENFFIIDDESKSFGYLYLLFPSLLFIRMRDKQKDNNLLRQYVRKWIDLRKVTDEDINFTQARSNNQPKKYLDLR